MDEIMDEIEGLQEKLSKGEITVNAPCGNDPVINLLGGLHARAAINKSHKGRFPNVAQELETLKSFIGLIK